MRAAGRKHRKGDGGDHEDDGRPGCSFGQNSCGGAASEGSLAAHAAESGRDIAALPALQQHYDNEKSTDNDVDDGNQNNHVALNSLWRSRICAR